MKNLRARGSSAPSGRWSQGHMRRPAACRRGKNATASIALLVDSLKVAGPNPYDVITVKRQALQSLFPFPFAFPLFSSKALRSVTKRASVQSRATKISAPYWPRVTLGHKFLQIWCTPSSLFSLMFMSKFNEANSNAQRYKSTNFVLT
jgi:hypothetical protein